MIPEAIDAGFICVLMMVGLWLERIGGKPDGWADNFFTPHGMAFAGCTIVLIERYA